MTKKFNLYLGKAGHLAMMAEFLMRGWNVAIPEVDIGDDIFVVQDKDGTLRRVQVKTATANESRSGFSARYQIPKKQLMDLAVPIVHYVFMVRHKNDWCRPLIIRQDVLKDYVELGRIGTLISSQISLYFSHRPNLVTCSGVDFTKHFEDYSDFPIIEH